MSNRGPWSPAGDDVFEVGTYALLRAYAGPETAFYVRGIASILDGGAGIFRVDAADVTSADNGGTILVDGASRRWKREFSGLIKAAWFEGYTGASAQNAINAAVAALPSTGGDIEISGVATVTGPIVDTSRRVGFVLTAGAEVRPTSDTDVFRIVTAGTTITGQGTINGVAVAAGSGSGVVVGYGGAVAGEAHIAIRILNMRGWGIKWEQGSFLSVDSVISDCVLGGMLCTDSYDDNNHGDILLHAVNCSGPGFRTVYNATTNLRSRHHHLRQIKAFGCVGGILIETEENTGVVFAESNTGYQVKLDTNAWGNILFCTGANGEPDYTEVTANTNMLFGAQGGGFNYPVARNIISKALKIRDSTNTGSISVAMSAANTATLQNADATNTDFTLKLTNKDYAGGYNLIAEIDKIKFRSGSATINYGATALVNLAFGTVNANTTVSVSTGFVAGSGDTAIITYADTATNLPTGIVFQASIDFSSGALSVIATNVTASNIVVGTVRIRYLVFKHF